MGEMARMKRWTAVPISFQPRFQRGFFSAIRRSLGPVGRRSQRSRQASPRILDGSKPWSWIEFRGGRILSGSLFHPGTRREEAHYGSDDWNFEGEKTHVAISKGV